MLNQEQIDYIKQEYLKLNPKVDWLDEIEDEDSMYELLEGFECIITQRHGARRWSEEVDYVHKIGDRYFKHSRDEPLTEMQDGQDTDDSLEEVIVKERVVTELYWESL